MSEVSFSGILTFLFTDLEGSTPLWEQYPDLMQAVSARHDELLRAVFEGNGGRVVKTTGMASMSFSFRPPMGSQPPWPVSRP